MGSTTLKTTFDLRTEGMPTSFHELLRSSPLPSPPCQCPVPLQTPRLILDATCSNVEASAELLLDKMPKSCRSVSSSLTLSTNASSRSPSPRKHITKAKREETANLMKRVKSLEEAIRFKNSKIARLEVKLAAKEVASLKHPQIQSEEAATDAEIQAVFQKSEKLLRHMAGLDSGTDVKHQWSSMSTFNEDSRDRLARIEVLVTKRSEQLKVGDEELKLCRRIHGCCVGSQRPMRKWSLSAQRLSKRR